MRGIQGVGRRLGTSAVTDMTDKVPPLRCPQADKCDHPIFVLQVMDLLAPSVLVLPRLI